MWQTLILPCWLALASLTAVHAAEGACQDYTLSPAEAFAGDLGSVDGLTHWEWQAGHEFVKQGSAKLMDNGIKLSLAAESQSSVRLNSRLQFQPLESSGSVQFTLQLTKSVGVMYSAVLWPSQNEEGLGEVDLEILSKQDGIIQGPIWKPGDADTPIPFSNPPEKWAGQTPVDPAGPSLTIGDGVQPGDTANQYVVAGFEQTAANTFMMEYTPTSIAWSVNGKLYAQFTKGSGDQLWPWQSAMDISFSIWEDPAKAGWMGTYAYNPESLASMTITDFQYKGCAVTSGGDTDAGSPDDSEGDTEDGPGEVGGGDGSGSNPGPTSTGGDTPGNSEASGVSGGNSTSESGGNASGSNMSGSDGGPKTSIVWVDPTDSSSAGDDKDEPETTTLESTEETEETEEPVPTTSDDTEDDVDDSIDDGSQDVDNGAIRLSTAFSLAVATFISLRLVDVHA